MRPLAKTGSVLIISDPDGVVQAVGHDFASNRYSGLTVEQSQRRRAERPAWREVVSRLAGGHLAKVVLTMISMRDIDLLRTAALQNGWTETWKVVDTPGQGPEDA